MHVELSSRVAAKLVSRLAAPRVSAPARAAERHEKRMRLVFLRSVKRARADVKLDELTAALQFPGSGAALYAMQPVIDALLEPTRLPTDRGVRAASKRDVSISDVLLSAMADGAESVDVCVNIVDLPRAKSDAEWAEKLSEPEKKALGSWAYNPTKIREYEATGVGGEKVAERAAALEAAVRRAPVYEGDIYRGLASLKPETAERFINVGDEVSFNASASFSISMEEANVFAAEKTDKRSDNFVLFHVKNNQTGVDISKAALFNEKEVLVPKGARYRIVRVNKVKEDGKTGYHVELEQL